MPSTSARRLSVAAGALAGLAVLAAPAGAAPTGFPVAIPAGGPPIEVAAHRGVLAWLTTADGNPGSLADLHVRSRPGTEPTAVAVRSSERIGRLSVGTDRDGRTVVLAVRSAGRDLDRFGALEDTDVVRIDPRTGRVSPVPGAAKPGVDETAASVDAGRLLLARRDGDTRPAIYELSLGDPDLERLRAGTGAATAPQRRRDEIVEVAAAPNGVLRGGRFAFRTLGPNRFGEFPEQRAYVGGAGTSVRRLERAVGTSTNDAAVPGLSWESRSRLWFGRTNNARGTNLLYRYSTLTRRQAQAPGNATARDLAFADPGTGVVIAPFGPTSQNGVAADTLYATGPLTTTRRGG